MKKLFVLLGVGIIVLSFAWNSDQITNLLVHYKIPFNRAQAIAEAIIEEHTQYCKEIDPLIVLAIMKAESDFRNLVGDGGKAIGYMQLHAVATWYVANFYPSIRSFLIRIKHHSELIKFPVMQIRIGYRYLCLLYKFVCEGDLVCAIKRFNGDDGWEYYMRVLKAQQKILEVIQ
ncbi:MAG TPA: lytic transglycosylase domain-containing protein [Thermotogaceae bacterium]|nr:lytic transglycosylase domain-containing protein [Thermotogaceae bacterium]